MKQSVGISAGLMIMLLLLMIMPSTTDGIKITVKANRMIKPLSWTINVEVNETDKVEDLKKNIMETLPEKFKTKHEIELKKISLQYGENDNYDILNDGQTIGDYGIKNGDTVRLSIGEFQIVVRYEKKDEIINYPIWVKRDETVAILKKKIGNESGIEPKEQKLKCNTTNGPLLEEDKKTLKEYGIENGTIILLSTELFEVVVEYVPNKHWKKYKITVKKTDTLATLKDKIREKYTEDYNEYGFGTIELVKEFLTDEREPFVMRNDVVLWHEDLDEYKTMEQCGIREGSMVSVFYAHRLIKEEHDE